MYRNGSGTTGARIRSIWQEYKVIRSMRDFAHPNIVRMTDFIMTPRCPSLDHEAPLTAQTPS